MKIDIWQVYWKYNDNFQEGKAGDIDSVCCIDAGEQRLADVAACLLSAGFLVRAPIGESLYRHEPPIEDELKGERVMQAMSTLLGAAALLGAGLGLPERAVAASLFDHPLKTRHVRLKADPLNPQAKRVVSCFTYARFVVKQVDLGEVGADRLSIIPAAPGKATPCRREKEQNEYVIEGDTWSGYFGGVKSDYAFFDAADGTNGGLGFMVFRVSDKRKLFDDTAEKGIRSLEIKNGTLKLRYQRVFAAKCSVVTAGPACRDAVMKETGVAGASLSSCANGYQAAKKEMAKMRCDAQSAKDRACVDKELKHIDEQKWDDAPTVIVYEVEVGLGGASPVIKRLSDALACRPSD